MGLSSVICSRRLQGTRQNVMKMAKAVPSIPQHTTEPTPTAKVFCITRILLGLARYSRNTDRVKPSSETSACRSVLPMGYRIYPTSKNSRQPYSSRGQIYFFMVCMAFILCTGSYKRCCPPGKTPRGG